MELKPKILILDKSDYITNLLLNSKIDCDYKSVNNFKNFKDLVLESKWNVILCYLDKTDPLNIEVYNFTLQAKKTIPFIYFSNSKNERVITELFQKGVFNYINNRNENRFKHILNAAITLSNTQKALQRSKEHYKQSKAILNSVNTIVLSADASGEVTFVSPSIEKLTGYSVNEVLVDGWYDLSFEIKSKGIKSKKIVAAVASGKKKLKTKPYDRKIICKSGEYKWFEWHDSIGENDTYVSVGVDITEWVKAKEQILQADTIIKHINSMVFVSNKQGDILFASPSVERTLGYSVDEVLGNGWWELTYDDKKEAERVKKLVYKFVYENEIDENNFRKRRIKTKDGSLKWIEWKVSKGINNTYISIGDDVTERIIADEKIHEAKEIAENSLKVKSEFIANMSHEIRTPMNAVIGFTDLLLESDIDDEQKSHLESMKNSGEILLSLINKILDISKLESNKFELEYIPFNIYKSIHKVVDLMKLKANEKKIKLNLLITAETPYFLLGDPTRLSQILLNLIGNAIKFTREGRINVVVDKIKESKEDVIISIEVKDTGIGILSNKINTVFGAFNQVKTDTSRIFGGTGLGLTIVKKMVDLMGGNIKVESEFGVGSLFKIELPYKKVSEKIVKSDVAEFPINKRPLNLKILLVEDNLTNQLLAKTRLERWKCNVEIASNGFEAVKMVEKDNTYDIILMDIQMPLMDGFEATKIIKNDISPKVSKIPVIAMTAFASKEDIKKANKLGMHDYILKPFNPNELYTKLLKHGANNIDLDANKETINNENYSPNNYEYIDLTYLQKETIGEKSIMVVLIEMFLNDFDNYLKEAKNFIANNDFENLAKATHKVKPNVSMLGITKMDPLIEDINKDSNNNINLETIPEKLEDCENIFEKVKKELQTELISLKDE